MSGFATLAALQAAPRLSLTHGATTTISETAGTWARVGLTAPTTATTPGTVYDNDANTLTFGNVSTVQKFLTEFFAQRTTSAGGGWGVWLMDRLVGVSQSIVGTGDKTINSSALTRYTSGDDVQVFLEVTTATTVSAPVVSLASYTNQSGTSGRAGAAVTFPAAATNLGCWIQMPLQAGDWGVRSVETINVATAPSAGVVNVVLVKPLAMIGNWYVTSGFSPPTLSEYIVPKRIFDGASLALIQIGDANTQDFNIGLQVALDV